MNSVFEDKTLLIVDDEPDLREPLVEEFKSLGCRVFEASNGIKAFDILKREHVDAVISDIRMPDGDGVELLKNIKERDHNFPVVMLITGFSDLSREDAYDLGAEAIVSKPFDLNEIELAVARILTPPKLRWQSIVDANKIKMTIEKEFTDIKEAMDLGHLRLGRGGVFVHLTDRTPAIGESIGIKIKFQNGNVLMLEGAGLVRWVRCESQPSLPNGIGIEFESLDESTRDLILEIAGRMKMKSFIPKS